MTLVGSPVVILDEEEKAIVGEIVNLGVWVVVKDAEGNTIDSGSAIDIRQGSGDRADYWENVTTGMSGHPTFIVIGRTPVLLGIHWGTDATKTRLYDTRVRSWRNEINTAMSNLGSSYVLTQHVFRRTAMSPMALPGPVRYTFSPKGMAGYRTFNLAAAQTYIDGAVMAQTYLDGSVASQTRVDGAVMAQTEPS